MSEILNIIRASKSSFICLILFQTQINMNLTKVIPWIKALWNVRGLWKIILNCIIWKVVFSNPLYPKGRWKGLIIKVPSIIALAPFENHKGYIKKKYSFQKKVAQNIFIQKWSTGKVIKVKVLFFLLYLLWFTNGTRGYYTWNLDDQALKNQ